uniref:Uncharacterized protein n=1 Tax=Arundo donax TaxID=35708 RepID=A0A0A9FXC6_ARUDO
MDLLRLIDMVICAPHVSLGIQCFRTVLSICFWLLTFSALL